MSEFSLGFGWLFVQCALLVYNYSFRSIPWWVVWFPSLLVLAGLLIFGLLAFVVASFE